MTKSLHNTWKWVFVNQPWLYRVFKKILIRSFYDKNLTSYTFLITNLQPSSSTSLAKKNNNLPKLSNTWGLLCLVFQAYGVLTQIEKLPQKVWFWVTSPLGRYLNPSRKIVLNNLDSDLTSTLFYGLYYGFQNHSNYGVFFSHKLNIKSFTDRPWIVFMWHSSASLVLVLVGILCTLGEQKLLLILCLILRYCVVYSFHWVIWIRVCYVKVTYLAYCLVTKCTGVLRYF